jgi:hypothetical protein
VRDVRVADNGLQTGNGLGVKRGLRRDARTSPQPDAPVNLLEGRGLTLGSLTARKDASGRVVLSIGFRRAPWASVSVKLTRSWAVFLRDELDRALERR